MKKFLYTSVAATTALVAGSANANTDFGQGRLSNLNVGNTDADIYSSVGTLIRQALVFVGLLVFLYALYGGFLILTAGGEDDKVTKGRKVIVQAVIGLIVIVLAFPITNFILDTIGGGTGA